MTASPPARPLTLMLVCGEPSGDQLGGQLMASLKTLTHGAVAITGVGGEAMAAQGLRSLFPLDATAVMGLREVVPKIPEILARVRQAADFAVETRPDAVVLIDSPDFTHRIARRLKKIAPRIVTINYVAPQVWASRAYRARAMARYFDMVLALLPFEAPFFETYGLRSVFVGHPAVERAGRMTGGGSFRSRHGIAPDAPLLAVLPGSRTNEIRFIFPVFREAVALLAARIPGLVAVLPTVPHVAARVRAGAQGWPVPLHIVENEDEKFAAFDAADAALAASGTVTTELALSRTPMVVAYKVGWLTAALMRPLIHVKFATLVNLLLDREAVPEFLQERCKPAALADAVAALLTGKDAAARQVADLGEAMRRLGQGGEQPSLRAARAILDFIGR
ncbi:MAG: lipid-A-disaccharide synthase [Alphaproteobacteria bacterium]|nr:lipid-A-disaccharide synthase [Alphaproteobacteria bacterium]MDE2111770.1 lipid-A-disaccharide synthase [Alphaproteobacteria bacterium]MDE2494030.1 lipid-A-disaccharide synthase [Alphaproteobacteria bacterium]